MGRAPCCEKDSVKRGPWTPKEDAKLLACIAQHGTGSWRTLPKKAGLQRCGKSCRLRWTNYLRPDLNHGRFSEQEEQLIVKLHAALGSRWSLIAAQLPGRTDNDVKNYWNTRLKKKLCEMGIDPITHKPISQLLADLAGSITLPKGSEIAEATLGCFKDDMLNVLMRKRSDLQHEAEDPSLPPGFGPYSPVAAPWDLHFRKSDTRMTGCSSSADMMQDQLDSFAEKIKHGLCSAVKSSPSSLPTTPFTISSPSGPVNCIRSASSSLARRSATSMHQPLPHHHSLSFPQLPTSEESMLDALLESGRNLASFTSTLPEIRPDIRNDGIASPVLHLDQPSPHQQMYMSLLQQQEAGAAVMSRNVYLQSSRETIAWSPSCSASSSNSTSVSAPQVSSIDGVLNSDALQLWDLSELGSMIG